MRTLNLLTIIGARPQFIKAAAVSRAITAFNATSEDVRIRERIVHTGQHYDENMSDIFFDELKIQRPTVNLAVGSGPHGWQTGKMLERLEQVLLDEGPDLVLIYGDTNSTLAGALGAAKLRIPVAHVEAGLRSFNRRMPEEVNRVIADRVSTFLLCPTTTAVANLAQEGITRGVYQVGDVMYDSALFNAALAEQFSDVMKRLGLKRKAFYLATIHRAENTDDPARLADILEAFSQLETPTLLPLHPRTRKTLGAKLKEVNRAVRVVEPLPYLDMLMLEKNCRMILTDSGGVQKEAYWFGVPCVTLRDETEWVELVGVGCNRLVGADAKKILAAVREIESTGCRLPADRPRNLYGEGKSAETIISILAQPHHQLQQVP